MKYSIYLFIFSSMMIASEPDSFIFMSFNTAMKKNEYIASIVRTKQLIDVDGFIFLQHAELLFNKAVARFVAFDPLNIKKPECLPRIPKIIHQIWLGGEVPDVFKPFIHSIQVLHSDRGWVYKLWTDADLDIFDLKSKALFDQLDNYGAKADLLRIEILQRYGGVYLDMDFQLLRSLDCLHDAVDFYTAFQPLDTGVLQLGNALIGCIPNHPILELYRQHILTNADIKGTTRKTGPIPFTQVVAQHIGRLGYDDVILPAYYFYPLGCMQRMLRLDIWKKEGCFGVHHWAKTWMPAQYRFPEFKTVYNTRYVKGWDM